MIAQNNSNLPRLIARYRAISKLAKQNPRLKKATLTGIRDLDVVARLQFLAGMFSKTGNKGSWNRLTRMSPEAGLEKAREIVTEKIKEIAKQYDKEEGVEHEILLEIIKNFEKSKDPLGGWLAYKNTGLVEGILKTTKSFFRENNLEQITGVEAEDLVLARLGGFKSPLDQDGETRERIFSHIGRVIGTKYICARTAGPVTCLFGNFKGKPPIDWGELPDDIRAWRQKKITVDQVTHVAKDFIYKDIVDLFRKLRETYIEQLVPEGESWEESILLRPGTVGSSSEQQMYEALLATSKGRRVFDKFIDALSKVDYGILLQEGAELMDEYGVFPGQGKGGVTYLEIRAPEAGIRREGRRQGSQRFTPGETEFEMGDVIPLRQYLAWKHDKSDSSMSNHWNKALMAMDRVLGNAVREMNKDKKNYETKKFQDYLKSLDSDHELLDLIGDLEELVRVRNTLNAPPQSDYYDFQEKDKDYETQKFHDYMRSVDPDYSPSDYNFQTSDRGSPFVREFAGRPPRQKRAFLLRFASKHPVARKTVIRSFSR